MHRIQAIVLLIAAFFLFSGSPAAMAADAPKPAPTAEQLQAEYAQIQVQYQLVQAQRENLAYRERDLKARAQEIQAALKAMEGKSGKADVKKKP